MPRLLAVGHVSSDVLQGRTVPGGAVTYAALSAARLGWEAGVLTSAGPDFEPERDLPGVAVFVTPAPVTTRFVNDYAADGTRRQRLTACAEPLGLDAVPPEWRAPDVLMLAGVAGEVPPGTGHAFDAAVVGAGAQGWLRAFDEDGEVHPRPWRDPAGDLSGVHVLFLSEHDLPEGEDPRALLRYVPMVAVTRGWRGVRIHTRPGTEDVPSWPRAEVDPTGAGDVFAAAFLVRYHETGDASESAAFASCAAGCAVEGLGASTLGDRAEVEGRLVQRARYVEEGEWEEP